MNATFYCDESGTTGNDWNNIQQPFLIYGGWLVLDESKNTLKERISKLLSSNLIAKNSTELKANRFFKHGKNYSYFKKIFDYFISENCFPIFIVLEKNYMVALKITETIFDPTYSVLLKDGFTGDTQLKQSLAKIVASDKNIINKFSDLIHSGNLSIGDFKKICNELAEIFSSLSVKNVSSYLRNLPDLALEKMLDEFQVKNTKRSLTIPALFHILQLTQDFCYNYNIYAQIMHDNIKNYDEYMDIIRNSFINTNIPDIIKIGNNKLYSNLSHISKIELCDSKDEYFIQLADLLIGFILRSLKAIQKSQSLSEDQKVILMRLIVLYDTYKSWDYVISDDFMKNIFKCINSNYIDDFKTPNYALLNKKFESYLK